MSEDKRDVELRVVEVTVGSLSAKDEERVVMDRPALRRFLDEWPFCGCGCPEVAAGTLLRLLRLHPLYEHERYLEFEGWIGDEGVRYLLLYALDGKGLADHGGIISMAWLTDKGDAVRDALTREEADAFEALFADHCAHGYDDDDEEHDCMAYEAAEGTTE
jgi:hypothetical protein